jgi:hypothetical protein
MTLLFVMVASQPVSAATVNINRTDRGWYTETGQHTPTNLNYIAGDGRYTGCGTNCYSDMHNFFVFDLAGVTQPIGSAKLALFVPAAGAQPGYISPQPSENYELHDVSTPIATLLAGTGGVAAHADLGSGVVYGSRTMTAADMGSVVEITLNSSAIAAMNATHGLFGLGGSVTTLDALANNEVVFAWTNSGTELTELRLTLVPEPSALMLLATGVISLLVSKKPSRKASDW